MRPMLAGTQRVRIGSDHSRGGPVPDDLPRAPSAGLHARPRPARLAPHSGQNVRTALLDGLLLARDVCPCHSPLRGHGVSASAARATTIPTMASRALSFPAFGSVRVVFLG